MATEINYDQGIDNFTIILASTNRTKGRYERTQKTLTVVIRFDDEKKVKKISYHASKF